MFSCWFNLKVECKVRFGSRVYNSNQHCELAVFVRVNCVEPIQFDRLYVRFSQAHYNQFCLVEERSRLFFEPGRVYQFRFRFLPTADEIGKELEVSSISMELGDRQTRVLVMHWRGDCKNALSNEYHNISSISRLTLTDSNILETALAHEHWDDINVAPSTTYL